MMRKAASSSRAFRSLDFVFTMSMTCLRVTLPTFVLFGSLEPAAMLAAFFKQNGGGRTFGDEGERLVFEDGDHDRENVAGLFLGGGVKFLAERHDVNAARTQCGSHRRSRVRLARGNLQFDLSYFFFGHKRLTNEQNLQNRFE